jgi:tRNA(Arg) A34 adenosine deaminase TadA
MHLKFLQRAIELADKNIDTGGGPFGAVIVKDGKVIAEASNQVTVSNDPTAHAEVVAIRNAGKNFSNFDLSECILYASCEPCPMCLGAIYWARIEKVYYAADRFDAEKAGFDDSLIYDELAKPIIDRKMKMVKMEISSASSVFRKWSDKTDKEPY